MKMEFDANNVALEYLLQPELLNKTQILAILSARCISTDNMQHLNKDDLLNIFYRLVSPKQQRTQRGRKSIDSSSPDSLRRNKKIKITHNIGSLVNDKRNFTTIDSSSKSNNTLNGNTNVKKNNLKRLNEVENGKVDESSPKKTRQRICWP